MRVTTRNSNNELANYWSGGQRSTDRRVWDEEGDCVVERKVFVSESLYAFEELCSPVVFVMLHSRMFLLGNIHNFLLSLGSMFSFKRENEGHVNFFKKNVYIL